MCRRIQIAPEHAERDMGRNSVCSASKKTEPYDIFNPLSSFFIAHTSVIIFCLTSLKPDLPRVMDVMVNRGWAPHPMYSRRRTAVMAVTSKKKRRKSPDSDDKKGGKFWKDMERYGTDPKWKTCTKCKNAKRNKKSLQSGPKWNGQQRRHEDTIYVFFYVFFCFFSVWDNMFDSSLDLSGETAWSARFLVPVLKQGSITGSKRQVDAKSNCAAPRSSDAPMRRTMTMTRHPTPCPGNGGHWRPWGSHTKRIQNGAEFYSRLTRRNLRTVMNGMEIECTHKTS